MQDKRNVIDKYKGWPVAEIALDLDKNGVKLEIAIENSQRDFNMGTIVRSANAFGVRRVHIIGSRQWNKRGAMATDKYLEVKYHQNIDEFMNETTGKTIYAVDNIDGAKGLSRIDFDEDAVLVFGAEGPGLSEEIAQRADTVVAIEQFGSTRSINVGVAAGITMYAWARQHLL